MLFDRILVSLEVFFFCPGRNYKIEDELQNKIWSELWEGKSLIVVWKIECFDLTSKEISLGSIKMVQQIGFYSVAIFLLLKKKKEVGRWECFQLD